MGGLRSIVRPRHDGRRDVWHRWGDRAWVEIHHYWADFGEAFFIRMVEMGRVAREHAGGYRLAHPARNVHVVRVEFWCPKCGRVRNLRRYFSSRWVVPCPRGCRTTPPTPRTTTRQVPNPGTAPWPRHPSPTVGRTPALTLGCWQTPPAPRQDDMRIGRRTAITED